MLHSRRLRAFGTRLEPDLIREVKKCSVIDQIPVQKIVAEALRDWLSSRSKVLRSPREPVKR